jgi:hypothetical protein
MTREQADRLARYQHLRQVALPLNHRLVKTLSKSVLDEGGKKLGILEGKALVLDSEDEIAVLMDYCIYDVRRRGQNAIDHFLAKSPPAPDSDEMVLLQAMGQAYYAVVVVEKAEHKRGVHVRDLLRDEPLFLTDVGFSLTGSRGMVLATRVMAPEGIHMTTGAALPMGVLSPAERTELRQRLLTTLRRDDFRDLSPDEASRLAATIIRQCLQQGAAERIEYIEPTAAGGFGVGAAGPPRARRVAANARCPCGSGKKYKNCCGAGS